MYSEPNAHSSFEAGGYVGERIPVRPAKPAMKPWLPGDIPVPDAVDADEGPLSADRLPTVGAIAELPRTKVKAVQAALCFGITLLVYLAFVPRFILYSSPPTGDQAYYLMDTISLVQDGDLNVANNYENLDEDKFYKLAPHPGDFVGISAPYPLPPQTARSIARPPSEWYASHRAGLPVLIAPAWIIGSWFSLWWPATVVFMCLLGALVALNIFLLAYELTGSPWIAWVVWLPLAFSNPLMTYSYLVFTELPVGLLLIYAFRRLALGWNANGPFRLLLIGACIGYIPWLAWRCLPISAGLGLYAAVQWWRCRNEVPSTESKVPSSFLSNFQLPNFRLVWLYLPIAVFGGLLAWYNVFLFGSVVPDSNVLENGTAYHYYWPWGGLESLSQFLQGAFGLLFDQRMGLLIYAPIYLLSAVGFMAMFASRRKSDKRFLLWLAVICLPYIFMIMAFEYWHGIWGPPARYLTTFAPLMAAPLSMSLLALSRSRLYKAIYGVMGAAGVFLMAAMLNDARLFWPSESLFNGRDLFILPNGTPIRIDMSKLLPTFLPPDEATHPIRTGQLIAISLIIVLFCYLLLAAKYRVSSNEYPVGKKRTYSVLITRYSVLGWVAAIGLIGTGWFGMNYEFLKHKTTLYEQARWNLADPSTDPRGIAYLLGKIYATLYNGQAVLALDPANGQITTMHPVSGTESLAFFRPDDVKVGPDGLLYVLNNKLDEPTIDMPKVMYAMKPDGAVVKQVPLLGRSDSAFSLQFGPNANIYVGDTKGGAVRKYAITGGEPLTSFGGKTGTFNNVAGVVVDADGTIYAAEGSNRVQKLDPAGGFLGSYELGCQPRFMALNGEWLEIGCGSKLLSINNKTGATQFSLVAGDALPLQNPQGLAYGPDGTLYVADNGMLIAYKVAH